MSTPPVLGQIAWVDLTVPNADAVRDFYAAVVGWTASPVSMGEYDDHAMVPAGDTKPVAGVCHARGPNTGIPPVWLLYVTVADLQASLDAARARGGELVGEVRDLGAWGTMAIVRDPAGAAIGLIQPR